MNKGDKVVAVSEIVEEDFPEKGNTHTHASPDDTGTIVYVDDNGFPTVRFDKTGTATIVFPDEIKEDQE